MNSLELRSFQEVTINNPVAFLAITSPEVTRLNASLDRDLRLVPAHEGTRREIPLPTET